MLGQTWRFFQLCCFTLFVEKEKQGITVRAVSCVSACDALGAVPLRSAGGQCSQPLLLLIMGGYQL